MININEKLDIENIQHILDDYGGFKIRNVSDYKLTITDGFDKCSAILIDFSLKSLIKTLADIEYKRMRDGIEARIKEEMKLEFMDAFLKLKNTTIDVKFS